MTCDYCGKPIKDLEACVTREEWWCHGTYHIKCNRKLDPQMKFDFDSETING